MNRPDVVYRIGLGVLALPFVESRVFASPGATVECNASHFRIESTTRSIGIELDLLPALPSIADDNHNALCSVAYSRKDGLGHPDAVPLLRIDYQGWKQRTSSSVPFDPFTMSKIPGPRFNMCAGSIMYLSPGTEYVLDLSMSDGEGHIQHCLSTWSTKPEPKLPPPMYTVHVGEGTCSDCAVSCTASASCCDGSSLKPFKTIDRADEYLTHCLAGGAVCPSTTLGATQVLLHNGLHKGGIIHQMGSPGNYIAWKAAPDEVPILESTVLIQPPDDSAEQACGNLWFEGLTFQPRSDLTNLGMAPAKSLAPPCSDCATAAADPPNQDGIRIIPPPSVAADDPRRDVRTLRNIVIRDNVFVNAVYAVVTENSIWGKDVQDVAFYDKKANRGWWIADNYVQPTCSTGRFVKYGFNLQAIRDSEIARNRIIGEHNGCKGDAIRTESARNIDIYNNDVFRTQDDVVDSTVSYANVRIWENRAVSYGSQFVSLLGMMGAPWYLVKNEAVGAAPDGEPLKEGVFDRFVLLNNTFVAHTDNGLNRADMLLRSISRNNLWIHLFRDDANFGGGRLWRGEGDKDCGGTDVIWGMSRADWRTDMDFDGFDVSVDADPSGAAFTWLSLPGSWDVSLANLKSGILSSCDQPSSASIHPCTGELLPRADCSACVPSSACNQVETNATKISRQKAFKIYNGAYPEVRSIEDYERNPFFARLDSNCTGTDCPVDKGSATDRFGRDISGLIRFAVKGAGDKPDLGAFEQGSGGPSPLGPADPLRMPLRLTSVTRPNATTAVLKWRDRTYNQLGFVIERREIGTGAKVLRGALPGAAEFTDTGLIPGKHYVYRLWPAGGQECPWTYSNNVFRP